MANFFKAEQHMLQKLNENLSSHLHYHSYYHTLDVLNAAMLIAEDEKISNEEISLLRVAIAYHDAGFLEIYKGHELKSCEYARAELPKWDFSKEQIDTICGIIMATQIPQSPTTQLQRIIADADLDYLGREEYFHIAHKLFTELAAHHMIGEEAEWHTLQQSFMESHDYFTPFSKQHRNPQKKINLEKLRGLR